MRGRATWRSDPHLDAGPAADGSPGATTRWTLIAPGVRARPLLLARDGVFA